MQWDFEGRRQRLLERAIEMGCDIVLATMPQHIYYLTGFWGTGVFIMRPDNFVLVTSRLEENRAQDEAVECEVSAVWPYMRTSDEVNQLIGDKKVLLDDIKGSLGRPLDLNSKRTTIDPTPFIALRRTKDAREEDVIAGAAKILDKLFQKFTELAKPGLTERQVGALLVFEAMSLGAEPASHNASLSPVIVASGSRGAYPHANLTGRKLKEGDFVVLDLTFRYKGYYADATRTFAVSRVTREGRKTYDAVLEALRKAEEHAKPGSSCDRVDAEARKTLEEFNLEQYFVHSTGHGVGLDIHEAPSIRVGSSDILREGDVFTLEPGVYIKGRHGIRIEDTVSMRKGILNRFTKELIEIDAVT